MLINKLKSPQNTADRCFNLAVSNIEIFKDQNHEPFIVYREGSQNRVCYFDCPDMIKRVLRKDYLDAYHETIKATDVNTAYDSILAYTDCCAEIKPVANRIYQTSTDVYYDLNDGKGNVIRSGALGTKLLKQDEIKNFFFSHDSSMNPQKYPDTSADRTNLIDRLQEFFSISESQIILFTVYVCAAFIPNIPHPILLIEGEKGAGKSTALRTLSKIINPVKKDLFVLPKDVNNLVTVLSNNYYVAFDNVGTVSPEICNILCQAVTGGSLSKRKLYSDNSEVSINIRRLVALNGISMHITQSDLMDRAIMIQLNRIDRKSRATEESIDHRFNDALPEILGAILQIVGHAISIREQLKLTDLPRMADFSAYGYCIAESIEHGFGEGFLKQYAENIKFATETIVGDDPILDCMQYIIENYGYWYGSMTDLLKEMRGIFIDTYIDKRVPIGFPKTASALSRALNTHKEDLMTLGIPMNIGRGSKRYIEIGKKANKKSVGNDGIVANSDIEF